MKGKSKAEKVILMLLWALLSLLFWLLVGSILEIAGVGVAVPNIVMLAILVLMGVAVIVTIVDTVTKPIRRKKKEKYYEAVRNDLRLYVNDFATIQYDVVSYKRLKDVDDLSRSVGNRKFEFVLNNEVIDSLEGVYDYRIEYAGTNGLMQHVEQPIIVKCVKGIDRPVFEVTEIRKDKQVEGFSHYINPTLCIPIQ